MHDTLHINKKLIPYTFSMLLGGELFDFRVDYNETHGFFTIGFSKDGEIVCSGEKIVYGKKLFEEIYEQGKFPAIDIIPYDQSGEYDAVTYDNLSETVLLCIDNQEESIV